MHQSLLPNIAKQTNKLTNSLNNTHKYFHCSLDNLPADSKFILKNLSKHVDTYEQINSLADKRKEMLFNQDFKVNFQTIDQSNKKITMMRKEKSEELLQKAKNVNNRYFTIKIGKEEQRSSANKIIERNVHQNIKQYK